MNLAFESRIYPDRAKRQRQRMNSRQVRLGLLVMGVSLLMVGMAPAVFAAGQINCLTPPSCVSLSSISLTGPGSTGTATLWLHSVPLVPDPNPLFYYVCESSVSPCTSTFGTFDGWSWSFTPATGAAATGSLPCTGYCEGNGFGVPDTLTLTITAPSVVTSSNQAIDLSIYACNNGGSIPTCNSIHSTVATGSVTATVPQFQFGMGLAVAVGLVGLVMLRRIAPKSMGRIGSRVSV